eukprot:8308843-Pyramimonas_sp.AAC.1
MRSRGGCDDGAGDGDVMGGGGGDDTVTALKNRTPSGRIAADGRSRVSTCRQPMRAGRWIRSRGHAAWRCGSRR